MAIINKGEVDMVKKRIFVYSTKYMNNKGGLATVKVITFGTFPKKRDVEDIAREKVSRVISATCDKVITVEMSAAEFLESGTILETEE